MELDLSQIYTCPSCRMETPHYLLARREDRVGIACARCQTVSLVDAEQLETHQAWWEDELRQILSSLDDEHRFDEDH